MKKTVNKYNYKTYNFIVTDLLKLNILLYFSIISNNKNNNTKQHTYVLR